MIDSLERRMLFSAGALDLTFGTDGVAHADFIDATHDNGGNLQDELAVVRTMPDGRILAVGTHVTLNAAIGDNGAIAIARFNTDGSPDTSFGDNGKLITDLSSDVRDAAILPDGKIVLADGVEGIIRLNPDGTRDRSFGTKGIVHHVIAQDVISTGNGTFLMEETVPPGQVDFQGTKVVLYNADGTIAQVNPFDVRPSVTARLSLPSPQGIARFNSVRELFLLDLHGRRDPSFPVIKTSVAAAQVVMTDAGMVALLNDGTLAAFDLAGNVNADFGNGGVADVAVSSMIPKDMFRQSDGKLLVTGVEGTPTAQHKFFVARYNADGSFDDTFATNGVATLSLTQQGNTPRSLTVGTDGSILVGGDEVPVDSQGEDITQLQQFTVARLWRENAPAALFHSVTLRKSKTAPLQFQVDYRDDERVNLSSLDDRDLQIVLPDGTTKKAYLLRTSVSHDSSLITATYKVAAPDGKWSSNDNGSYTVRLRSHQVSDTAGNFSSSRTLGAFRVSIPAAPSAIVASESLVEIAHSTRLIDSDSLDLIQS
jgi:uncharacterized delta-60 repeat protein